MSEPGRPRVDAAGERGAPFTMDIERGKVREFARATHAPADPYLTADAPPIPPTFLATARVWDEDTPWTRTGLAAGRLLHAEQEYVFHGPPPRAGDRLVGESRIEDVYVKEGRSGRLTFAVMVTEFRDGDGRLVAESRLTGVEIPAPEASA